MRVKTSFQHYRFVPYTTVGSSVLLLLLLLRLTITIKHQINDRVIINVPLYYCFSAGLSVSRQSERARCITFINSIG